MTLFYWNKINLLYCNYGMGWLLSKMLFNLKLKIVEMNKSIVNDFWQINNILPLNFKLKSNLTGDSSRNKNRGK